MKIVLLKENLDFSNQKRNLDKISDCPMSTYKTYVDRFAKSKSVKKDSVSDLKLTTDKEAYTQFLEIQLERISQAILQLDSFNDKIEGICTQVNTNEEKLNNSNKLVKLLQSFADAQVIL